MQVEHDDDKQLVERIFSLIGKLGYHKKGYIAVKVLNNVEDMKDARTTHSSVGAEQAQV
jgi:hypothetical protein